MSAAALHLATPRCHLRPLEAADAPALHALWTHPDVRRYLWDDRVVTADETAAIVAESARLFEEERLGLWGVRLEDDPELAGFGGYWYFREPPVLELLLGIAPDAWGRGVATEVGTALLGHGFGTLGFHVVHASTDAPNRASIRVMEKLGFVFERRAVAGGLDTLFYAITRERFVDGRT